VTGAAGKASANTKNSVNSPAKRRSERGKIGKIAAGNFQSIAITKQAREYLYP